MSIFQNLTIGLWVLHIRIFFLNFMWINISGFRIPIRIRTDPHKFADPDPGKKVRKWINKSLFCRVGDVQCKQFHFFCSDFKHPLLRIIWNVKKTKKKIILSLYPQPPPPDTPRIRIRIRMKIFVRIRIRKKKCGSKTLIFFSTTPNFRLGVAMRIRCGDRKFRCGAKKI